MSIPTIGQIPPAFRLPSGQGPDIGPEEYRGRSNLIVWFTKGMACPFCRQKMSQLARGHSQFRALNAEILEVTPSPPERGRFYVQKFGIPFPYLCDPDHSARKSWGLEVRSHSPGWYLRQFVRGATSPKPANDFGSFGPSLREFPALLADDDTGFFILDRSGAVRFALAMPYVDRGAMGKLPGNDEITRELERCEGRGAR